MRLAPPRMIDDSIKIPAAVINGQVLMRGTLAWDIRERARELAGYDCISMGYIPEHGGLASPSFWRK